MSNLFKLFFFFSLNDFFSYIYFGEKAYVKALEYKYEALKINEEIGNKNGSVINLGNIGSIYLKLASDTLYNIVPDS